VAAYVTLGEKYEVDIIVAKARTILFALDLNPDSFLAGD
jgi:hypothetical protein